MASFFSRVYCHAMPAKSGHTHLIRHARTHSHPHTTRARAYTHTHTHTHLILNTEDVKGDALPGDGLQDGELGAFDIEHKQVDVRDAQRSQHARQWQATHDRQRAQMLLPRPRRVIEVSA